MGSPPDFATIAEQVLAFTRVDWDPKYPKVGEQVLVNTIPGILPFLPPDLVGGGGVDLPSPLPSGTIDVLLEALVKELKFTVKYTVQQDGMPLDEAKFDLTPLSPISLPDSDPLQVLLLIAPPLVEDRLIDTASKIDLLVTVSVTVEGNHLEESFTIPLNIPPIPLPAFLVLTGFYEEGDPERVFMMVRNGSSITGVSEAITTINAAIQSLNSVKDVLDFGLAFDALVGGLADATNMIQGLPIAGFAHEQAPNLDDYDDFDEEPRASLLFGPVGTSVELFSGEDFNSNVAIQAEKSTFTITEDFGAPTVTTGFGIHKVDDFSARSWDSDPGITMNPPDTPSSGGTESCRFV